jgi:hypothetical protein
VLPFSALFTADTHPLESVHRVLSLKLTLCLRQFRSIKHKYFCIAEVAEFGTNGEKIKKEVFGEKKVWLRV